MKILYPMQVGGGDAPKEVASLEEFIGKLNGEPGGTFLLGGNRIWHGGIHLSDKGGWHPQGAVRAIADGEIVAYRIASAPAAVKLEPEEGKPGEAITLHTSPSFCLVRHRYEATEEVSGQQQPKRNTLTFYCLYMHIACKHAYQGEPERHVLTGSGVAIYKTTASLQFQKEDKLGTARKGAEVTLIGAPSERMNLNNEPYSYQLVSYATPKGDDPSAFYIASQFIKEERKVEPGWMMAKQDIPSLYPVSRNSYLRKSKGQGEAVTAGLPKTSKVARTTAQPVVFSNMKEYLEIEVWEVAQGKLTDGKGNVVPNASKGDRYWVAKEMLGQPSDAVRHTPIVYDKVELRHTNPIPVKVGEVVGHWGEHETPKLTASGFVLNEDRKAIHMEIFVAESDKEALGKCISNEGKLAKGQEYLLLKEGEQVDTYKLTKENNKVGYSKVGAFGPLEAPKPIKTQDIVTHGADKFVKVAEDQHVLISGDTQLVSQHEWARLGVTLVDGGSDPDGFLDKADTDGKEGGDFFSTLYEELVTDRDGDGSISADEIKAAMAEKMVADKLRKLFIKHESEWVKRDTWPRLEQELKNMPNLYKYVLEVTNKMAWIEEAAAVVGDTKPWFIHPAGMMGLVGSQKRGFIFTLDIMKRIYTNFQSNNSKDNELQGIADELNEHIEFYQLDTPLKRTHFFAQILQETGPSLSTSEGENWSINALKGFAGGRNRRYPDGRLYADAHGYKIKDRRTGLYLKEDGSQISQLDKIEAFNTIYGNRPRDLGNGDYDTNDGWNFRGRGLKQVTGRYNYTTFNTWHRENQAMWPNDTLNAVLNPELLSDIKFATRSAAWFWIGQGTTKCFEFASEATDDAVNKITDIVNYHTDSRANRIAHFWRLWNEKVLHEN
ncbi:glycoside hydrolase family 19 protein [Aeromonas rivipollensis]|uniref:glycoside hydrolase family 19 protein n=1 Tax=Aeromonas rivipollensis TaxID=948519 RepID=UPI00259D9D41|nr:glycoside hydrolase family 19 protein [Aeromonas rivipollensis]MDM5083348.1 glycoside hydrolase family 19 protein [Aeromonas rivipollensis]MDM5095726.1 glycoside hydrolase family 19 protein [Aeromonas rivipollensis]MDM5104721.1 glycoside hydrolase family 19 protein [Aeromonas rivipollensis]